MSKKELNNVSDSVWQGQSDQSTSTYVMPPADQKSESRMKHKPHPAENVNDSNPTM